MNAITSFKDEYAFLSNFHPSPIIVVGIEYPTVEHAYQAAKTRDADLKRQIASIPTPGRAKRFGRKLELRAGWEAFKIDVMRTLIQAKFDQHPDLEDMLDKTYPAQLIEGNNWGDTFWGVCRGKGENWLGRLLMEYRDRIYNEEPKRELEYQWENEEEA